MQVTNMYDLPEVIVAAVINDPYDAGARGEKYISVTTLCNPPQLTKLYWECEAFLTEDASERIWSLLGQSVHAVIERAAQGDDNVIAEKRFYVEIDDWTIGGQVDLYDIAKQHITDFKVTSVWSAMGDIKTSWNRQLNLLAYLLRKNGHPVESAEIVAILRDWSRTKGVYDKNYPDRPVSKIPAIFVDDERIESFIRAQLAELDSPIPRECHDDERWKRGGNFAIMRDEGAKFAVMRAGRKNALKLYDNEPDARGHARLEPDLYVEKREPRSKAAQRAVRLFDKLTEAEAYVAARPQEQLRVEFREAIYQRCEAYCPVREFCPQIAQDGYVFPDKTG